MTNEELRTKIVEILEETEYEWTEEKNGYILQIFYDKLADALIAAGIGDVSEYKKHRIFIPKAVDDGCAFEPGGIKQLYGNEEVEQIVKERDTYKRALKLAEELGELCAPASDYIKQAEKELAEEGKDEN